MSGHYLIVEARFYGAIADAQKAGAIAALEDKAATYEIISVPGALEIPAAIAFLASSDKRFDGYVALGCVIRGETSHYDTVCNESARGLMDLALAENWLSAMALSPLKMRIRHGHVPIRIARTRVGMPPALPWQWQN